MLHVAVVGASGYTGAQLVNLILGHPEMSLGVLVGHSNAGKSVAEVLPSLHGILSGQIMAFDPEIGHDHDAVFCALPHGASAACVDKLRRKGTIVFDLSADFRLKDLATYQKWYGEHGAPDLLAEAVYGLPELHREAIRVSDLIAVPGCYPTATLLGLAPLISERMIHLDTPVIVDAKSGVSGAGRKLRSSSIFTESAEGIRSYAIAGRHRHTVEIEQELSGISGDTVQVSFSPHLVPMSRGILATMYTRLKGGIGLHDCIDAASALYADSPSVFVHEEGVSPDTLWVRGSNRAHVSYTLDERTGVLVVQSVIDNLIKGAAGQAIQCFNVRFDLDEGLGIRFAPRWP